MPKRQYFIFAITVLLVATCSVLVTLYASGYRFDPQSGVLQGTGILSVSSTPDGALVLVNKVPKDATNTSITELQPDQYEVELSKEGYASWRKTITVRAGLVTEISALLVPLYPSLQPLTFTGAQNPIVSPDQQKIVYQVSQEKSAGIWLVNLEERPFSLTRKPQLLLSDTQTKKYSTAQLQWSPDANQLLITTLVEQSSDTSKTQELFDLRTNTVTTLINTEELLQSWQQSKDLVVNELLTGLTAKKRLEIKALPNPQWSPDNLVILYQENNEIDFSYSTYYVGVKTIDPTNTSRPTDAAPLTPPIAQNNPILKIHTHEPHQLYWFPDSKHLILVHQTGDETGTVELLEATGENRTLIFSGVVKDLIGVPTPNGSRIVILTRFNPESDSYNLYSIGLQ